MYEMNKVGEQLWTASNLIGTHFVQYLKNVNGTTPGRTVDIR